MLGYAGPRDSRRAAGTYLARVDESFALRNLDRLGVAKLGAHGHGGEHAVRALEGLAQLVPLVEVALDDREAADVSRVLVLGEESLRLVAGRVARHGAHGKVGLGEEGGHGAAALVAGRSDDGNRASSHGEVSERASEGKEGELEREARAELGPGLSVTGLGGRTGASSSRTELRHAVRGPYARIARARSVRAARTTAASDSMTVREREREREICND